MIHGNCDYLLLNGGDVRTACLPACLPTPCQIAHYAYSHGSIDTWEREGGEGGSSRGKGREQGRKSERKGYRGVKRER